MPQLHCYVPENTAVQLQQKAEQSQLSVSKYLARLIDKDIGRHWPEGYFNLYGSWEGDALQRPEQGGYEPREVL